MSAADRTLGELVGRLADLTVKLYMTQEEVHRAAAAGRSLPAEIIRRLTDLNLERSRAMTAVDEILAAAVAAGTADVDPRIKLPHDSPAEPGGA